MNLTDGSACAAANTESAAACHPVHVPASYGSGYEMNLTLPASNQLQSSPQHPPAGALPTA